MTTMTAAFRRIALFALLAFGIALPGTALAGYSGGKLDGRGGRAAIAKNRADRGLKGKFSVKYIRDSSSGKSAQIGAVMSKNKKVELYNVDKSTNVARRTPTGLMSQKAADKIAAKQLRKERNSNGWSGKRGKGQFSGTKAKGLSSRGSYVFASKTDRTQKVYVSPITGKITKQTK